MSNAVKMNTLLAKVDHSASVYNKEVNENTIYSSVKLFAHVKSDNVTSPIKLTVFAYNNENDFDPETGEYRGKSYHEIYIKKK